jgi:hypothetical protein
MIDDELSQWAEQFRTIDAPVAVPSADEIIAEAARDARKRRLEWIYQAGGTAFAALVFGALIIRTRAMSVALISAIVLPILFASFGAFAYLRLSASGAASNIVEHIALMVRHRRATLLIARVSLFTLVVLCVAFWAWLPFWILQRGHVAGYRMLIGAAAAAAIFLVSLVRAVRTLRAARAELTRWRAIATSFSVEECDSRS